jgi:hypothetical protein
MPGGPHPASPGFATKHLRWWLDPINILNMGAWPPDFRRGMHFDLASVVKAAC